MAPQGLEKLQMGTRIEALPADLPHCENQAALRGQQCWQALLISVSLEKLAWFDVNQHVGQHFS